MSAIESLKVGYKSKSGSSYYFTESGVYRLSNHWGRAANCKWRLQTHSKSDSRIRLGFANWTSFHPDNDTTKLYYIEWSADGVEFRHKDEASYNGQLLRTAGQTTQRIRQIRNILTNNSWTKYYSGDAEQLQKDVVHALIETDLSLPQIKVQLLDP